MATGSWSIHLRGTKSHPDVALQTTHVQVPVTSRPQFTAQATLYRKKKLLFCVFASKLTSGLILITESNKESSFKLQAKVFWIQYFAAGDRMNSMKLNTTAPHSFF